jgi:transcriptional antiterminator RfaH
MTALIAASTEHADGPRPWFVAYTKPAQEAIAQQQLHNQGFETYLPLYRVHQKPRGARQDTPATVHHEPMFARYLFVRPQRPGHSISAARYTRGVSHLVAFGQLLARVDEPVVQALRALEAQRNQLQTHALSPFQPGTLVRLRAPGLQGLQGVVVASPSARVQILLDILGGQRQVTVPHEQLIAA